MPTAEQTPTTTPEGHQAAQGAVATVAGGAVVAVLPNLDLTALDRQLPAFKAAAHQQITLHAQAAASLAVQQYTDQRRAAGVISPFRPVAADPPPLSQTSASVDWATQPLWDSAVPAATVPGAPAETQEAASTAIADAKARLAAASERLVGDTGARTITENAGRDRQAKGYARIPEPDACSFCLLLAIRGAVFKADSFAKSNASKTGSGPIKVHDHCQCHPEPVFNAYEPSARVREGQALYQRTVTDQGRTGKDARAAWRQAVEGREVTGYNPDRNRKRPDPTGASKPTAKLGQLTPAKAQGELNALLKHQDAHAGEWNAEQASYIANRIAFLRKALSAAA